MICFGDQLVVPRLIFGNNTSSYIACRKFNHYQLRFLHYLFLICTHCKCTNAHSNIDLNLNMNVHHTFFTSHRQHRDSILYIHAPPSTPWFHSIHTCNHQQLVLSNRIVFQLSYTEVCIICSDFIITKLKRSLT